MFQVSALTFLISSSSILGLCSGRMWSASKVQQNTQDLEGERETLSETMSGIFDLPLRGPEGDYRLCSEGNVWHQRRADQTRHTREYG